MTASSAEARGWVQEGARYSPSALLSSLATLCLGLAQQSSLIPFCWNNILGWKGGESRAGEGDCDSRPGCTRGAARV